MVIVVVVVVVVVDVGVTHRPRNHLGSPGRYPVGVNSLLSVRSRYLVVLLCFPGYGGFFQTPYQ